MDPCTTKPIPGAAQALLRPDRIAVDISDPDEWGDVHITIGRDERARLTSAVQQYRIDAPSTGGDALWLTRGQLVALIAAGQALLEPKAVPAKWASLKVSPACVAEAERGQGPRLRPLDLVLNAATRPPFHGPLYGARTVGGLEFIDFEKCRTGARPPEGLRLDFYFSETESPLDAPSQVPTGGHEGYAKDRSLYVWASAFREGE